MAMIFKRPWTRQPPETALLNYSNSLARGLQYYCLLTASTGNTIVNKAGKNGAFNAPGAVSTPCIQYGSSFGLAANFPGTSTAYAKIDTTADLWLTSGFGASASIWISPLSLSSAYQGILTWTIDEFHYLFIYLKADGKLALYWHAQGETVSYSGTGANTLAVGGSYKIDFVWDVASATMTIWVNDVFDDQLTGIITTAVQLSPSAPIVVGSDLLTPGRDYTGLASNVILASRPWTAVERKSISTNPWQLTQPYSLTTPISAVAPLPVLSAATYVPGSITSTGFRPRVTAT